MKFVSLIRTVSARARRYVSNSRTYSSEEVSDTGKLSDILRYLTARISKLESVAQPEATEFEVTVSTGGATVTLQHDFDCPVRWYVVSWKNASAGHSLAWDSSSNSKKLVLKSYVAGTAVVRVEPSQQELA